MLASGRDITTYTQTVRHAMLSNRNDLVENQPSIMHRKRRFEEEEIEESEGIVVVRRKLANLAV